MRLYVAARRARSNAVSQRRADHACARVCVCLVCAVRQHLAALGYKQELKRDITFMGSVGITLGCMQARPLAWRSPAGATPRLSRLRRTRLRLTPDAPRLRAAAARSLQPLLCAGVFYVRAAVLAHQLLLRAHMPPHDPSRVHACTV